MQNVKITPVFLLSFLFYHATGQVCLSGNCTSGYGTLQLTSGARYVGNFAEGKFDGPGEIRWPNGAITEGYFVADSLYSGQYRFEEPDYPVYTYYSGPMRNYKPHGTGRCKNEFHAYAGEFADGLPHGKGVDTVFFGYLKIYRGDFSGGRFVSGVKWEFSENYHLTKYEGQFYNHMPHGQAKYYEESELIYDGEWREGKYQGKGKLYANGKLKYEGEFIQGKMDGRGIRFDRYKDKYIEGFYSGDTLYGPVKIFVNHQLVYEGGYENESRTGEGILYENGKKRYAGEFKNNLPEGKGVYFEDSLRYDGVFTGNAITGTGTLSDTNGIIYYTGGFENKAFQGFGTFYETYPQPQYEGDFVNGLREGNGTLYLPKNDVFKGVFRAGKPESGLYFKKGKPKGKKVVYSNGKFKKG